MKKDVNQVCAEKLARGAKKMDERKNSIRRVFTYALRMYRKDVKFNSDGSIAVKPEAFADNLLLLPAVDSLDDNIRVLERSLVEVFNSDPTALERVKNYDIAYVGDYDKRPSVSKPWKPIRPIKIVVDMKDLVARYKKVFERKEVSDGK